MSVHCRVTALRSFVFFDLPIFSFSDMSYKIEYWNSHRASGISVGGALLIVLYLPTSGN